MMSGGKQSLGASVPDQALVASDGAASVSTLTGFDPSRMLDIMADLECALVMTREHDPTETVGGFVDCSIEFKRLADFLHSVQHDAIAMEARQGRNRETGSDGEAATARAVRHRPNERR